MFYNMKVPIGIGKDGSTLDLLIQDVEERPQNPVLGRTAMTKSRRMQRKSG